MVRTPALLAALLLASCQNEPAYQPPQLPPPPTPIVLDNEAPPSPGATEAQPATVEPQPAPPAAPPIVDQAPLARPAAPAAPAYEPAGGHWVNTEDYGWIWVPGGAEAEEVDGVPYAYLYTPAYGWTWYVSPWGFGVHYPGPWVHHPWHPRGTRVWVAPPHVVVRFGPYGGRHHGR